MVIPITPRLALSEAQALQSAEPKTVVDKLPPMEDCIIGIGPECEFKILQCIGQGAFGACYLAKSTSPRFSHLEFVVKCIPRAGLSNYILGLIKSEVKLHEKLSKKHHDNVLDFVTTHVDEENDILFIITEYCDGGDLWDAIVDGRFAGKGEKIKRMFLQILDGVESMHNAGVFHRDLKPENVFLKRNGTPVIGDFGFATSREKTTDFGMGTPEFVRPGKKTFCCVLHLLTSILLQSTILTALPSAILALETFGLSVSSFSS
jgi:serine/threonine protein kinase